MTATVFFLLMESLIMFGFSRRNLSQTYRFFKIVAVKLFFGF